MVGAVADRTLRVNLTMVSPVWLTIVSTDERGAPHAILSSSGFCSVACRAMCRLDESSMRNLDPLGCRSHPDSIRATREEDNEYATYAARRADVALFQVQPSNRWGGGVVETCGVLV